MRRGATPPHPHRRPHPEPRPLRPSRHRRTGRTQPGAAHDLTATDVASFDADHPPLPAQRIVNAVIDTETARFGVYRTRAATRLNVLADIRAVAGRALAYATP